MLLCNPEIAEGDRRTIESYPRDHDIFARLVPAHFTLVFPTPDVSEKQLVGEVIRAAGGFGALEFHVRCAVMHNDPTCDLWHVLLVPDQSTGLL